MSRVILILFACTASCTRAQLVGLLFPGESLTSNADLGKPCRTPTHRGVCVLKEQCGSLSAKTNTCGSGAEVVCCGSPAPSADFLDVSYPDVINPEVYEAQARCHLCGHRVGVTLSDTCNNNIGRLSSIHSRSRLSRNSRSSPPIEHRRSTQIKSRGPHPVPLVEDQYNHTREPMGFIGLDQIYAGVGGSEPEVSSWPWMSGLAPRGSRGIRSLSFKKSSGKAEQRFKIVVVGGFETEVASWPWMALIGSRGPNGIVAWKCDGAVVRYGRAHKWVVTAAHCFNKGGLDVVRLGEHDYTDATEFGVTTSDHSMEKVITHPDYSVHSGYYDIALVKLSSAPTDEGQSTMNNGVTPICLPWGEKIAEKVEGRPATLVGWGATEFNGPHSNIPQEVHMTVFNSSICDERYKALAEVYEKRYPEGIVARHLLCAGHPGGGRDACEGDSGGPLMTCSGNQYHLTGVVSHGYGCGLNAYPGLYTPLHSAPFLAWIKREAFDPNHTDTC